MITSYDLGPATTLLDLFKQMTETTIQKKFQMVDLIFYSLLQGLVAELPNLAPA